MRKFIFALASLCSLWFALVFTSCSEVPFEKEETVYFVLPEWPPEQDSEKGIKYPELSRWIVKFNGTVVNCEENYLSLTLPKNTPCCITALPITFTTDGRETSFFKPAGGLYPYTCCNQTVQLTWESGFSASLMEKMQKAALDAGYDEAAVTDYLSYYNWKKLNQTVCQNIEESRGEYSDFFYNPWLLNSQNVLEAIAYKSFSASKLNLTGILIVTTGYENDLLSSFIPENSYIREKSAVTAGKNQFNFFSLYDSYGIIISGNSAKNVSLEFIYLPIFEDI